MYGFILFVVSTAVMIFGYADSANAAVITSYSIHYTKLYEARISDHDSEKIQGIAKKAYCAMGCKGLSRVDFFLCDNGDIYLNEINTLPGFTSISMFPKLMEKLGITQAELLEQLIKFAFERADVTYE